VGGGGAAGAGAAIGAGAIGAGALVLIALFFFTWWRTRWRTTRFFARCFLTMWRVVRLGATYGSSIGGAGAAIGGGPGAAIGGGGGASFAQAASKTTIEPTSNGWTNLTTVLSSAERHQTKEHAHSTSVHSTKAVKSTYPAVAAAVRRFRPADEARSAGYQPRRAA
jgi:hypothetical protein